MCGTVLAAISSEFSRQMALRIHDMRQRSDLATLPSMHSRHAGYCCGRRSKRHASMLHMALGLNDHHAIREQATEQFQSSGTGRANITFPVQ